MDDKKSSISVPQKTMVLLTIEHYRDGKLINLVKPYATASLTDKILFHLGLKNLTRGL